MHFSDLAMNLKASEIRELLKLTTMPEVISLLAAAGTGTLPDGTVEESR